MSRFHGRDSADSLTTAVLWQHEGMGEGAPAVRRWPARAAAGLLAAVSAGCVAAAVPLHGYVVAHTAQPVRLSADDLVLATAYPAVAAVIVAHQRRNAVGWLLLTTAFAGPYLLAGQYAALSLIPGRTVPGAAAATWLSVWGYLPYLVVLGLVPLHFPDGRLPAGRRWPAIRTAVVASIVAETVARMFAPVAPDASPALSNPLALPHGMWLNVVTLAASGAAVLGGGACGVAAVWTRLRTSAGEERSRVQWLVLGAACLVGSAVVSFLTPVPLTNYALAVGLLLLLAAIAIGAIRHRLFDIGTALSRTLVYGPLTVLVVLAYAATVAGAGTLPAGRRITYAVVALVALLGAAARDQVQRLVDRMLFGDRRDPYAVLRAVRGRTDLATGPLDALAQLAEGLRTALKLPYVAVRADDSRLPETVTGSPVSEVEELIARDRADAAGVLLVGHRHPGERFTAAERAVLAEVADRAGTLLGVAALFHDLQHSRESLVAAREEERRRLRRDLHDGVGPQLAAMAMRLDAMTGRLALLDAGLAADAERLGRQLRGTVAELRRVVENLRPPALDDLGLTGALRQFAEPYAPAVTLALPGELPALAAATEVAVYRIAAEAVANAVRHARCERCSLAVRAEAGWLVVEVTDDGIGIAPDVEPGVGLHSIRDRASEVGGRLEVGAADGGGTVVRARLPIAAVRPAQAPGRPPVLEGAP